MKSSNVYYFRNISESTTELISSLIFSGKMEPQSILSLIQMYIV